MVKPSFIRNLLAFSAAATAATLGPLTLFTALDASRGFGMREPLKFVITVGIVALPAMLATLVIGLPTVALVARRGGASLRSFIGVAMLVALLLASAWACFFSWTESSTSLTAVDYLWSAALGLAMAVPGYTAYWVVAGRNHLIGRCS